MNNFNERKFAWEAVCLQPMLHYTRLEIVTPLMPIPYLVKMMETGEIDTIYYSPIGLDDDNESNRIVPLLLKDLMVEAYGAVYRRLDYTNKTNLYALELKKFNIDPIIKHKKVYGEYGCGSMSSHYMVEFLDESEY